MARGRPATRLLIFLSEDDRVGHREVAELLLERAHERGLAGATVWRGIEGFGATGYLRATRLPDLARGLPLVVEVIDDEAAVDAFLPVVRELARGALVTTEAVMVTPADAPSA
ncbi:MAG: DUF190 domain-containing protein [Actinomycetota bacterium]|nr:DUF190 domain-containing protein [Actinomycetota bacterium]